MNRQDKLVNWAKGSVKGYLVNKATGEQQQHFEINNIITYGAADIMAKILGGDSSYVPSYMGFIYGADATPGTALIDPPTDRLQTWTTLSAELSDVGVVGNVLISPLATASTYSVDGDSDLYSGNSVTLTAHSGRRTEYGYPTASPFAAELEDGDYFYQAMLLVRRVSGSTITYIPFSRVTLKTSGSFLAKPVGFELALFWQISYF